MSVSDVTKDDAWLKNDLVKTVQSRGAAIIAARKLSSALSATKAISDHCRDWSLGTKDWVSTAVYSDGSYGVPKERCVGELTATAGIKIVSDSLIYQNIQSIEEVSNGADSSTYPHVSSATLAHLSLEDNFSPVQWASDPRNRARIQECGYQPP